MRYGENEPLVASRECSWPQNKNRRPPTKIVREALVITRDCELRSAKQETKVSEKRATIAKRENTVWELRLNGSGRHAGSLKYAEAKEKRKVKQRFSPAKLRDCHLIKRFYWANS